VDCHFVVLSVSFSCRRSRSRARSLVLVPSLLRSRHGLPGTARLGRASVIILRGRAVHRVGHQPDLRFSSLSISESI